jgi:membrane-associated phospholipid phosphatase
MDVPGNCFPSLHVSLAVLAAGLLMGRGGSWRILAPMWASAIVLAVVTTRQHRVIDVVGGLLVAACAWYLGQRFATRLAGGADAQL